MTLPILFSFRRCPYAMRARMAIKYSNVAVELREVELRDMPQHMLLQSDKGTVPVLILPDGAVIDESWDIMRWALSINDPDDWLCRNQAHLLEEAEHLVHENDFDFKAHLDHYKYSVRYPDFPMEHYREKGEVFLSALEARLQQLAYLVCDRITVADIAVAPFVRQFSLVDMAWFSQSPYAHVNAWLDNFISSPLFEGAMKKYDPWVPGSSIVVFP
ncbi:MAG: glutathione S-transferase [Gammaproteobacteria bacterium]